MKVVWLIEMIGLFDKAYVINIQHMSSKASLPLNSISFFDLSINSNFKSFEILLLPFHIIIKFFMKIRVTKILIFTICSKINLK